MLLILLITLFQVGHTPGQADHPYKISHYTVADGLPMNFVNWIAQDHDGYMYFSTFDGLVRYDGYEFEVFNSGNTPGMGSNRLLTILVSKTNELWIMTDTGSVIRKSGPDFFTYDVSNGGFGKPARLIKKTSDGTIWLAAGSGLYFFDETEGLFMQTDGTLAGKDTFMIEPAYGTSLLVLNQDGLFIQEEGEVRQILAPEHMPKPFDMANTLNYMDGMIWISSEFGMVMVRAGEPEIRFSYLTDDTVFTVWNVKQTGTGEILINTSQGFYRYDPESNRITGTDFGFSSPLYRAGLIFEQADGHPVRIGPDRVLISGEEVMTGEGLHFGYLDREGGIWIGTFASGMYHIRSSYIRNIGPENFAGFENLYPVIEHPDGSIWTGSLANGVYRLGRNETQNWNTQNSNLSVDFARFLYIDENETIYAGCWADGLWHFSDNDWIKETGFSALYPSDITVEAMHRTRNGDLLIGTAEAMAVKRDGAYSLFDPVGEPRFFRGVRVIRETDTGTLLFGTNGNGLTVLHLGEAYQYTTSNSGIGSNLIRDIFVQSPDTLWLATENVGLTRVVFNGGYDRAEMTRITTADGLFHNSLHRIIADGFGYMWISSNGGIMRIDMGDLNAAADGRITRLPVMGFTEQDGMLNREANGGVQTAGLLSSAGLLYFPNQKGLTIIDPADFIPKEDAFSPIPAIKYLVHSGTVRQHPKNGHIQLDRGVRNIRIKLSAPNFNAPERLQFRYRMDGIVDEWEDATLTREAILTNLPAGEHTFRFTAGPQAAATGTAGTILSISVPPHFHETIWFYLLMLIGLAALVVAIVRYRTFTMEKRKRELQAQVDQQTIELREAAEQKSRFFSGITHELKTPLSLILNPLDDMISGDQSTDSDAHKQRLIMMKRSGERLNQLTDQILDVTRLNADAIKMTHYPVDLPQLTRQIAGQFQSRFDQREIHLSVEEAPFDVPVYVDPNAYERIIINLMNNAIRFSPRGGTISIRFSADEGTVSVEIADQGPGIAPEEHEAIFNYLYQVNSAEASEGTGIGLYLVRGLCRHMGGDARVVSEPGNGAAFIVTLRKGHVHFRETDTVVHDAYLPKLMPVYETSSSLPEVPKIAKSQTLLVVEDNYDFRNYLTGILSAHYNVIAAENGVDGLEKLENQPVDLVLSDVMMPGMNGLEFVRQLRGRKNHNHVPVIFLTAKNTAFDIEEGLGSGADVYLTKPIANSMLLSQIAALLRRESMLRRIDDGTGPAGLHELQKNVHELILRHLGNPELSINLLADALFISRAKLFRDWKAISDVSINDYMKQLRMEEAKILITEKGFSVKEASLAVGYPKMAYFSTSFKKYFGESPSRIGFHHGDSEAQRGGGE